MAVLVLGLFWVEAAYFLEPGSRAQRFAAQYWIGCSVAVIVSSWASALRTFIDPTFWRQRDRTWFLAAFLLPPALILMDGGGTYFTHVDGEGTQQLCAGMYMLRHDPSLGVYKMAYFAYLARQYVLNCLPSYLFGPSLWMLRLGNSLFFIGSYLFFLSGLAAYLRHRGASSALFLASYCGIMVALAEYTILNAREFEQTTMPIGATLFFLAAVLLILVKRTPMRFLWATWGFGFLAECYTPALGSWLLALAILLYLLRRPGHRLLGASAIYGVVCAWVAYLIVKTENPVSIGLAFRTGVDRYHASDRILRYAQGLRAIAGFDHSLLPAPLAVALPAALYLSWRYRDIRFPVICTWALAMAFASLTFVGSNLYLPEHDLHRALIVLPPLALGLVLLLARYLAEPQTAEATRRIVRMVLGLSMAFMIFAGACTVFLVRSFLSFEMKTDFDEVCGEMNRLVLSPKTVHPMRLYFVPPLKSGFGIGVWYFDMDAVIFPNAPPPGERVPGTYIFSYRAKDPKDRFDDVIVPSSHPRPYIQVEDECDTGRAGPAEADRD